MSTWTTEELYLERITDLIDVQNRATAEQKTYFKLNKTIHSAKHSKGYYKGDCTFKSIPFSFSV